MNSDIDIMVSVWMTSYNHEQYIRKAIDSILSQKTNYTYEIVIGDDCSTDSTREILKEYYNEYPNKIRLLLNPVNMGITANVYNVKCNCRGKYIVNLSGDDYWIDDNKIQKQVDFLESHPEYVAVCCTIAIRHDFDVENFGYNPEKNYRGKEYTLDMFSKGVLMPGHGMMMRNVFLTERGRKHFSAMKEFSNEIDDLADPVLVLEEGKVFIMEDIMSVYRVISNNKRAGKSNFNSKYSYIQKFQQIISMNNAVHNYLSGRVDLSRRYIPYISLGIIDSIMHFSFKEFFNVYNTIPDVYRKNGILVKSIIETPKIGALKFYGKIIKPFLIKHM